MKVPFTDFPEEFKKLNKSLMSALFAIGKKGNYILGKELTIFEKDIQKFLNVKHALGVGNWTEGTIMLLKALNFKKKR